MTGSRQTARAGENSRGGIFLSLRQLKISWFPISLLVLLLAWALSGIAFSSIEPAEILVGLVISGLAGVPCVMWLRSKSREFPAFQLFCLSIFLYYGRPILSGHSEYMSFPEATRLAAGAEVMVFLGVALLAYYLRPRKGNAKSTSIPGTIRLLPPRRAKLVFSICLVAWFLILVTRTLPILPYLDTFLNAAWTLGSSAGLASIFYLFCLMGLGLLKQLERTLLVAIVLTGVVVSFATGFLVGGTWILMVCLIGFTLGRGTLPLTPMLVGLLVVNFLQAGKAEMRAAFWRDGQGSISSVSDFSDIYALWLESSWNAVTRQSESNEHVTTVFDRQSLIQMQTLVTQNTPDRIPFLAGETYAQIPELTVPRFIWPEKPDGHLSDETLGIYYGIQTQESIAQTSIGFGLLGEAWANFGWAGLIGLALLLGFSMRRIASMSRGFPINSLYSILSVVWLAWSFQVENCLSSWLISLAQTLLVSLTLFYPLSVRRPLAPNSSASETDSDVRFSRAASRRTELGANLI